MTVIVYTGTIIQGQGHAAENYKVMIAEIAKDFPAVANCGLFGTINVRLEKLINNSHADHWTPQIRWSPLSGLEKSRLEAFGFISVKFEYREQLYDAWIILPEGHAWTYNRAGVEIIADVRIPGVAYGEPCAFHLDHIPSSPRPSWFGKNYGMT